VPTPRIGKLTDRVRICLVYDCLFPYTVGGAERWYRNLGERLAREGHDVTYVTLRQWERGDEPSIAGVRVVAVGPRMTLYTDGGRRRVLPPLVFGVGVLLHLMKRGSYEVVHTASFPYFSLLAAGLVRPFRRFRLLVDWHELWTKRYWVSYLGGLGGRVGWLVQRVCVKLPQRAFCFSQLHAERLRGEGVHGDVTVLPGEYAGSTERPSPAAAEPLIVFAGRHIPEKRVTALVPLMQRLRRSHPELRCEVFGDGPERPALVEAIAAAGLGDAMQARGFVESDEVQSAMRRALCHVLPSQREGYGMVVIESAAAGTPSVVVADDDNAAVELVEDGVNGVIARSVDAADLEAAVERVIDAGPALRESTADWFARNAPARSLEASLAVVAEAYGER
jgi:glycosyltransferase involved in cell wall biosynthesis